MMNLTQSQRLYAYATQVIPGGVNSPVRACKSVGSSPLFIDRAQGSHICSGGTLLRCDYGIWLEVGSCDPDNP